MKSFCATALLLLLCGFAWSQVNLNSGLVAWYPFTGNANDASGNNINGTVNGATLTTDRNGIANQAYYFNGSSEIQLAYSNLYDFAPSGTFSISLWVLPDVSSNIAQALVVKSPTNPSTWDYGLYTENNKAMMGYHATHVLHGTTTLNPNQCWYQLVGTYNNGVWNLFVNGVLEATDASQSYHITQDGVASVIALGRKGTASDFPDFYKGKMDEVRIYDRVLNQQEITSLANDINAPCGASLCTGSLGDPVVNITFGSGNNPAQPLSTVVPGASTTLTYVSVSGSPATPTPLDGQYTITNNIPFNSAWFSGALDHTNDVNGYMAFYNASEQPGEFYHQTVSTLCSSTTYEFAAWIANALDPSKLNGVKPDITFRIEQTDGTLLGSYDTGPIAQNSSLTWVQYGFFFTTPPGVTSVVLKMINNSPGGNAQPGNDLAIDDITFRPCGPISKASFNNGVPKDSIHTCDLVPVTLYGSLSSGYASPGNLWQVSTDGGNTWTDIPGSNSLQIVVNPPRTQNPLPYEYRMLSGDGPNLNAINCRISSNKLYLFRDTIPQVDFSFIQDICNPHSIQFTGIGSGVNGAPYWDFGDGNTASMDLGPTHAYTAYGNYTVKLAKTLGSCSDTISKVITVDLVKDDIILTPDTTMCAGTSKLLRTVPAKEFCWSPVTYLNNPNLSNPTTSTPHTITYYYNARYALNNRVVNGDFSSGNTGFISGYIFANPNSNEGQYFVGTSPNSWNPNAPVICGDHTSGNGNMMIVNGSPALNVNVWNETIVVTPNTNYVFSAWIQSISPFSPARLQFSINGATLGSQINASATTCSWSQFYTVWNSGSSTTAVISLVNNNNDAFGNDFALDDISFAPVIIKQDSVVITVDSPAIKTNNDTTVCKGVPVQLLATGGISYTWTPVTGLSNNGISNPVATPDTTTTYIVLGADGDNCSKTDSVKITIKPKPVFTASGNKSVCLGSSVALVASGGDTYLWSPATDLDDPSVANPKATPLSTTQYTVLISENLCHYDSSISVTVTVNPNPTVKAEKSNDIDCAHPTAQLNATGASSYTWSPTPGLDDPLKQNPTVSIDTTTLFLVKGSDVNGCLGQDTIAVKVTGDGKPLFVLPNAFTPDEAVNSCFGIRKWGNVKVEEFSIFNRWGQMVFTTKDPSRCWDGSFKGVKQPSGGYAYVIKAKGFCGSVTRTGVVVLIR